MKEKSIKKGVRSSGGFHKHRRKRRILAGGTILCAALVLGIIGYRHVHVPELRLFSESAVVLNARTGRILYQKAPDEKRDPGSLTKLAALLVFFEAIERGELQLAQAVPVSQKAVDIPASKAGLRAGEEQTVHTMLECILIPSGSDAVAALGETLYGGEAALVQAMNRTMTALGLENTVFTNCAGYPQEGHVSTAMDMAKLSAALIQSHPDVLAYSSKSVSALSHQDGTQTIMRSTNQLLGIPGVDGLKTGHTGAGGYCQAVTYSADGREHLVFVLMGAQTTVERGLDAEALIRAFG